MLFETLKKSFSFGHKKNTKLSTEQVTKLLQDAKAKQQSGQLQEAEVICRSILKAQPNHPYTLYFLGLLAQQMGQSENACDLIIKAIQAEPNEPVFYNSCGEVYWTLAENEVASNYFRKALELKPDYAEAQCNLGNIYFASEQYDEAIMYYEQALLLKKDYANAHINLGSVFVKQGRLKGAIKCFEDALIYAPYFTEAHYNLGEARLEQNQYSEAIKCYKNALSCNANFVEAHISLACTYILLDRFEEGWNEYEWRFQSELTFRKREFDQPIWDGSSLENTSVLIWFEQGIGDEVMFSNLLNTDVIGKHVKCFVECEPRLLKLFSRSFPDFDFFPRAYPADAKLTSEEIDYQIPIASLMKWAPNPKDLGKISPYLFADSALRSELRSKYAGKSKLIVGISWKSGSAKHSHSRSIPIELWKNILSHPDIQFVNLQYGVQKEEIEEINKQLSVSIYHDEFVDPLGDLDRFAAQVSAMDLIISVDNATVQISGALGVKTWTILSSSPDYRWGLERDECLWYPNMSLFRQKVESEYFDVMKNINDKLIHLR
jgi:tetratricopeptide (TPR) repeat protein